MIQSETALFVGAILVGLVMMGCGTEETETEAPGGSADTMMGMEQPAHQMDGMAMPEGYVPDSLSRMNLAPLVKAYYDDGDVYFIHTEASDSDVADTLTVMMGPQVVTVPELVQAPSSLTSPLYVFENGIEGLGPFGYQPDLFPTVPGDEGYTPLRTVYLVTWHENASPEELRSVAALEQAQDEGSLSIENSGIVVNAPVLAWPGKTR